MLRSLVVCSAMMGGTALACSPPPQIELDIHLAAVNAERAEAARAPLALSPELNALAQAHACDMVQRGFFSHTSPDGRSMMDRARRAGISGICAMGENIAQGQSDVPTVVASWMRSSGHRRNILDRDFNLVGFGRGPSAHWVQVFAGAC
ncbi:MAG: CAP domain-containing protein [Natronohydrobacter sp.]|nr:CAP domain-containing protein [Natronohydrobacter sp.]